MLAGTKVACSVSRGICSSCLSWVESGQFADSHGLVTVLGPVVELLKDQPSGSVDLKSLQIQVSVKGHLHVDYIVQDNGQHQA